MKTLKLPWSWTQEAGQKWPAFFIGAVLVGMALLGLTSCTAELPRAIPDTWVLEGSAFGTYYVVKIVDPGGKPRDLQHLRQALEDHLADVDAKLSTYRPDSELSRWNQQEGTFELSPETFEVLRAALEVSAKSGGAFDPTAGPLINALGFGPAGRQGEERLDDAEMAAIRAKVGYQKLLLPDPFSQPHERWVTKTVAGMYVDLSAIGEGHAIDRLTLYLKNQGFEHYLVELGGEARAVGQNAEGKAWRIGIERPQIGRGAVQRVVSLVDRAIATSGDYRKFYEKDGVRVSHLVDARTGQPIRHRLASVSVVAPSCRFADSWATALMVLGEEEGYELAKRESLAALFLVREGDHFVERSTPEFEKLYPSSP